MKFANAIRSLLIAAPEAGKFVVSSGVGLVMQDAGGPERSSGKSSFATPISTL